MTAEKCINTSVIKWVFDSKNPQMIKSSDGRFYIDINFRKQCFLRDTLNGYKLECDSLEEAKNQAEFMI